jgi:hypothetical protein
VGGVVVEQPACVLVEVLGVDGIVDHEAFHESREDRVEQLVLVAEVGVQQRLVAAREVGDAVDSCAGDAPGRELGRRRLEDAGPRRCSVSCHTASI